MDNQQQYNEPYEEKPLIQVVGPSYKDEQWTVSVAIGPKHTTLYGKTEEATREQMEQYLDQQIAELEKARTRLRELLERPKKNLWPDHEPDEIERWENQKARLNARIEQERTKLLENSARAEDNEDKDIAENEDQHTTDVP